jgi:hypothetical protein
MATVCRVTTILKASKAFFIDRKISTGKTLLDVTVHKRFPSKEVAILASKVGLAP